MSNFNRPRPPFDPNSMVGVVFMRRDRGPGICDFCAKEYRKYVEKQDHCGGIACKAKSQARRNRLKYVPRGK